MTRINSGIKPRELPSKLLLAELREIKRVPNVIKSGRFNLNGQPRKFTLGTGHVKFFYTRLGYLRARYLALRSEALQRQYNVQDFSSAWDGVDPKYMGDYVETTEAREEVIERIHERGFKLLNIEEQCQISKKNISQRFMIFSRPATQKIQLM